MTPHYRWDLSNAKSNLATSICRSLATEGVDSEVKEMDGTYTITLEHDAAFAFLEFLAAQRDAKNTRIKNTETRGTSS